MSARVPTSPRLSVDDWLRAGYSILAEDGLHALKMSRLCERLGVTKGSFYWHFVDMAGYRAALVDAWGAQRGAQHEVYRRIEGLAPRERLSQLIEVLASPRQWRLERTMREWARSDPAVAASVEASDHRVLQAVRKALTELGFDAEEAELRAVTTFAAGVGFLHLSKPDTRPLSASQRERLLAFILRS